MQRHLEAAARIRRERQIASTHDAHLVVELHVLGCEARGQRPARLGALVLGRRVRHHLDHGDALKLGDELGQALFGGPSFASETAPLSEERLAELRALGYVD